MEEHLAPFIAAIAAGTRQILLSYGVPTWQGSAGVGFCFDRDVVTGILRERLGFDGIVSTDWGVINDVNLLGQDMPAPAWGLEELTPEQRILRALEAGVDQFGGEYCPELVVDLVRGGAVTQDRLDASAARILREKFTLGLFDQRRVDVDRVPELVGQPRDVATGREMQTRSLTVLGDRIGLPLALGTAVHLDGLDPIAFDGIATVVGPEEAHVTIVRVEAPFEPRAGGFEALFHAGSLELDDPRGRSRSTRDPASAFGGGCAHRRLRRVRPGNRRRAVRPATDGGTAPLRPPLQRSPRRGESHRCRLRHRIAAFHTRFPGWRLTIGISIGPSRNNPRCCRTRRQSTTRKHA